MKNLNQHSLGFFVAMVICSFFAMWLTPYTAYRVTARAGCQQQPEMRASPAPHVCTVGCINEHRDLAQPVISAYGLSLVHVRVHCDPIAACTDQRDPLIADVWALHPAPTVVVLDGECKKCKTPGCVEAFFYLPQNGKPTLYGDVSTVKKKYAFARSFEFN